MYFFIKIEKGNLITLLSPLSTGGQETRLPASEIKDKRMISVMLDHFGLNLANNKDVKKSLLPAILSFLTNGDWEEVQKAWYRIKQVTFAGLPISIENAKGTYREGTDKDGHDWKVKMYHDYGYIRRTEGTDGDQIDVYLGLDDKYTFAYIVHQNDTVTGIFGFYDFSNDYYSFIVSGDLFIKKMAENH